MLSNKSPETLLKNLFLLVIGIVVLGFLFQLFGGSGYGYGGYPMGRGYNTSLGGSGLLAGVLILLVKLLWLVMLVALVIGIFVASKKYIGGGVTNFDLNSLVKKFDNPSYICPNCKAPLAEEFKFCPNCKTDLKNRCSCGKELQVGWSYCPHCAKENPNYRQL